MKFSDSVVLYTLLSHMVTTPPYSSFVMSIFLGDVGLVRCRHLYAVTYIGGGKLKSFWKQIMDDKEYSVTCSYFVRLVFPFMS